jgi:hypothetical protein
MLRALEVMERRQLRLHTRLKTAPGQFGGLRIRTLFAGAVWLALAFFPLAFHRNIFTEASFSGYLVIGFWGAWTIWLVNLLRRVARH